MSCWERTKRLGFKGKASSAGDRQLESLGEGKGEETQRLPPLKDHCQGKGGG